MALIKSETAKGRANTNQPVTVGLASAPVRVKFEKALAAGDVIELCSVYPRERIADFTLIAPNLDAGAGLEFDIGELNADKTALAVTYEGGLKAGHGDKGSVARATLAGGMVGDAAGVRTIGLIVKAAAATDQAEGKTLVVNLGILGGA